SRLRVTMEPVHEKKKQSQKTPICHDERGGVFDQNEYDKDLPAGVFRVGGSLFDGQVTFKDFTISQQRHKVAKGGIAVKGLDVGTVSNMIPGFAFSSTAPKGSLTATLDIKSLPFDAPKRGDMTLRLDELRLERGKNVIE